LLLLLLLLLLYKGFNIIHQHVRSVTGISLLVDNARFGQCP